MISSSDAWSQAGGRKASLSPVTFSSVPRWSSDRHGAAFIAFHRSCLKILRAKRTSGGTVGRSRRLLAKVCNKALDLGERPSDSAARKFFETYFTPHVVTSGGRKGLLTGYYEPILNGSRTKTGKYTIPVYRKPDDLEMIYESTLRGAAGEKLIAGRKSGKGHEPYETRAQIEQGSLDGKGLELVYLDDAIDAYFMHIQGSARIKLTDGTTIRIGYAAKNGYAYKSIGGVLIEKGEMTWDAMSLKALRKWMERDAEIARRLMWQNKSYIFFREHTALEAAEGAKGAMEIPLTTGRSLAVDAGYHAMGTPVYVSSPRLKHAGGGGFNRLMVAQDVGSAIKGPERGDLFFGSGDQAGALAGQTKHPGKFFVLMPKKSML